MRLLSSETARGHRRPRLRLGVPCGGSAVWENSLSAAARAFQTRMSMHTLNPWRGMRCRAPRSIRRKRSAPRRRAARTRSPAAGPRCARARRRRPAPRGRPGARARRGGRDRAQEAGVHRRDARRGDEAAHARPGPQGGRPGGVPQAHAHGAPACNACACAGAPTRAHALAPARMHARMRGAAQGGGRMRARRAEASSSRSEPPARRRPTATSPCRRAAALARLNPGQTLHRLSRPQWQPTREGYVRFLAESRAVYAAFEEIMAKAAHPECEYIVDEDGSGARSDAVVTATAAADTLEDTELVQVAAMFAAECGGGIGIGIGSGRRRQRQQQFQRQAPAATAALTAARGLLRGPGAPPSPRSR